MATKKSSSKKSAGSGRKNAARPTSHGKRGTSQAARTQKGVSSDDQPFNDDQGTRPDSSSSFIGSGSSSNKTSILNDDEMARNRELPVEGEAFANENENESDSGLVSDDAKASDQDRE